MLVLGRRVDEAILLVVPGFDKPFRISVEAFRNLKGEGRNARLGIDVPAEVQIYREEIYPPNGSGLMGAPTDGREVAGAAAGTEPPGAGNVLTTEGE